MYRMSVVVCREFAFLIHLFLKKNVLVYLRIRYNR
jgi:hypothetical protein